MLFEGSEVNAGYGTGLHANWSTQSVKSVGTSQYVPAAFNNWCGKIGHRKFQFSYQR